VAGVGSEKRHEYGGSAAAVGVMDTVPSAVMARMEVFMYRHCEAETGQTRLLHKGLANRR
jgi:hypothetical protein